MTGPSHPFRFHDTLGYTVTSAHAQHLRESIVQILGTRRGERLMRPTFGSRLHELLFETQDDVLYGLATHYVREALTRWEPRVHVQSVAVERKADTPHRLQVAVTYTIPAFQQDDQVQVTIG